jgi:hypothetical protein
MTAKELRRALRDHSEPNLFAPNDPDQQEELQITAEVVRSVTSLRADTDCNTSVIDSELLASMINVLSSDSISDQEATLGAFTRRKLKKLSSWP